MSTMLVTFGENRLAVTDPEIQKQIVELVVLQSPVLKTSRKKEVSNSKMNKPWTDKDKALLTDFVLEDRSVGEIALILGRTKNSIRVAKSKLNSGK